MGKTSHVEIAVTVIVTLFFSGVWASCFFGIWTLEYDREQNICRSSYSRVETAHDAINAIRYITRKAGRVGSIMYQVQSTEAFQNDGLTKDGGWRVEEWKDNKVRKTLGLAQGYTVSFRFIDQSVHCDVLDCGGVDISNCLTLG